MPSLISAFPNFLSGKGVFSEMGTLPWGDSPSKAVLDLILFSEYGTKNYSTIVMILLTSTNTEILSDSQRQSLATLIKSKYSDVWSKRYSAITASYSAEKNVDMSENETTSDDMTASHTGTVGDVSSATSTVANKVFGFDSTVGADSSSGTGTNSGTNTQTNNLSDTSGRDISREKSLSGNNGNVSKQELIMKELELRKWNFFDSVILDVESVLSIPIFNSPEL